MKGAPMVRITVAGGALALTVVVAASSTVGGQPAPTTRVVSHGRLFVRPSKPRLQRLDASAWTDADREALASNRKPAECTDERLAGHMSPKQSIVSGVATFRQICEWRPVHTACARPGVAPPSQ